MARTRRLLFVTVPMHGHINPLLEPASQLVKQGQCVLFVTYEQHRSAVEAAGIPFKSLGPDCIDRKQQSQIDPYATKKAKMLASAALFTGWEEDMYYPLLQTCRAFQPDVVVADMTTLAAHDAAETLKLPLALLGSMPLSLALDLTGYSTFNSASDVPFEDPGVLVLPEHMSLLEKHLINPLYKKLFGEGSVMHLPMLRARDALREQWGLPDMPLGAGPLQLSRRIPRTITILATSWLMEAKRELPHNWHLVGAMGCDFTHDFPPPLSAGPIKAYLDDAQAAGRQVVLVATGTTTVLPGTSVLAMAQAFASLPDISFAWSLKQESQEHLPRRYNASNVLITHWVPQTAVLGHPAVKGFLCHGGHTTTNEALATGTPMLCMPFGGDQLVVAQHIKDHGYGLQIGLINHTPDAIAGKIQKLLSKPEYAANAASAGQKVRSVCGPALTAWLLADFARPPPEVETDPADSTDDTEEAVSARKKPSYKQRSADGGKEKETEKAKEKSWWPRFDRRTQSTGDLSRSAVIAH